MKSINLLSLVISSIAGLSANAATQNLSFEQLKIACQNPAKFHNQIAPSNIQISCKDVEYKWSEDKPGSITLPKARYVSIAVQSDKYLVAVSTNPVQVADQMAACPKFKQFGEVIEFSRASNCEELISYNGTGIEFCAEAARDLKANNPAAVQVIDTGKVVDLCSTDNGNGQRGQR